MTNCPNCNALLSYDGGLHCDYCGTVFERPHEKRSEPDPCETVTFYSNEGVYYTMRVHSSEADEDMARAVARGLYSANEARGFSRPAPAGTHETR